MNAYAGTGAIRCENTGEGVQITEYVQTDRNIGTAILPASGAEEPTNVMRIRYGKGGVHVVPVKAQKEG